MVKKSEDDLWEYDECPVTSGLLEEDQRFVFEYYSRRSAIDAWEEAYGTRYSRVRAQKILATNDARNYALKVMKWRLQLAVPDPARIVQGLEEIAYNPNISPQWRAKALENLSRISGLEGDGPDTLLVEGDDKKPETKGLSPEKSKEIREKILGIRPAKPG